jgi:hypothetical protein
MKTNINPKLLEKYTKIAAAEHITEQELENFRSFLNSKLRHYTDTAEQLVSIFCEKSLDDSHVSKGLNWLKKSNLTAKGKLKSNAFLGYKEMNTLMTAVTVKVHSIFNMGYKSSNYLPAYTVYNNKGEGFSYQQQSDGKYKVFGYSYDPGLDMSTVDITA